MHVRETSGMKLFICCEGEVSSECVELYNSFGCCNQTNTEINISKDIFSLKY